MRHGRQGDHGCRRIASTAPFVVVFTAAHLAFRVTRGQSVPASSRRIYSAGCASDDPQRRELSTSPPGYTWEGGEFPTKPPSRPTFKPLVRDHAGVYAGPSH